MPTSVRQFCADALVVISPASSASTTNVLCTVTPPKGWGPEKGAPILALPPETQWLRDSPCFWRTPVLRSPFYIDRYCETVHKRLARRISAIPSSPVPEDFSNALRFAHDRRRHQRARLWTEGRRPEPDADAERAPGRSGGQRSSDGACRRGQDDRQRQHARGL